MRSKKIIKKKIEYMKYRTVQTVLNTVSIENQNFKTLFTLKLILQFEF